MAENYGIPTDAHNRNPASTKIKVHQPRKTREVVISTSDP